MVSTAASQFIEVTPIAEGSGFIALKTDKVEVIENYRMMIHVVNITQLEESYQILVQRISNITQNRETSIPFSMERLREELTFLSLTFSQSRKRSGLINGIGSLLKGAFGTLDADDLDKLNGRFETVEHNEENVLDFDNKLITFHYDLNDELNNITDHINQETNQLTFMYDKTSKK